jgi:hypothetical protein
MNAIVSVVGDPAMAEELLALVESRAGAVASFAGPEAAMAAAAKEPPAVIVVGAQLGAGVAMSLSQKCDAVPELSATRVILIGPDDGHTGGEPFVVPRRDCFATVGALLRFDPSLRVPVQILARYELVGDAHQQKRLGNVVELGVAALSFDADQALPELGTVFVSFVVPGTGERLRLVGVLDPPRPRGSCRDVRLEGVDEDARRSLRRFIEKRLVRTPAEVP